MATVTQVVLATATPAVPTAPTAALAAAGAGNVDNGTHVYACTFGTARGQTPIGVASSIVTVVDKTANGQVALTAIPTGPAWCTQRFVYRSKANTATPYALVGTIADNTTTTFTDNVADASLGAAPPATDTTGTKLAGRLQTYYTEDKDSSPDSREAVRGILKVLIDLGVVTGVTASDVDAQHRAISASTKISG